MGIKTHACAYLGNLVLRNLEKIRKKIFFHLGEFFETESLTNLYRGEVAFRIHNQKYDR